MNHANIQGTLGRSHRGRNDFRMGNTWRSRVRWQKVYVYQYVPTARNYTVSYWRKILHIFITDCKKLRRKLQSLKMTPSSTLLSLMYVRSFKPSKGVNRYPLSAFVRPIFRIKSFDHRSICSTLEEGYRGASARKNRGLETAESLFS